LLYVKIAPNFYQYLKSILKGRAVIAYIFILIFYIFSSAYFSLAETAFTCVNRYKMRALAQNGNISAKLVLKILAKFDLTLIAILIGNNFVNIGLSFIATYLFLSEFSGVIDDGIILLFSSIIKTAWQENPGKISTKNRLDFAPVYIDFSPFYDDFLCDFKFYHAHF